MSVSLNILLISTYELSRQPFGLASPAAWLRREDHRVNCIDCALDSLPADGVLEADFDRVPYSDAYSHSVSYTSA